VAATMKKWRRSERKVAFYAVGVPLRNRARFRAE